MLWCFGVGFFFGGGGGAGVRILKFIYLFGVRAYTNLVYEMESRNCVVDTINQ